MKQDKKTCIKVTLVKDIMYRVIKTKGKELKQDCDNPKIFYINQK